MKLPDTDSDSEAKQINEGAGGCVEEAPTQDCKMDGDEEDKGEEETVVNEQKNCGQEVTVDVIEQENEIEHGDQEMDVVDGDLHMGGEAVILIDAEVGKPGQEDGICEFVEQDVQVKRVEDADGKLIDVVSFFFFLRFTTLFTRFIN